ncbi:MAG: hypothetical protein SOU50_04620 [Oscillospiraceae bacterium]|nr:hypothetical protein [Oscillospiraceae bacterium]MDY2847485.1 hypothetical protein [Oscillospiraceae bacterium]
MIKKRLKGLLALALAAAIAMMALPLTVSAKLGGIYSIQVYNGLGEPTGDVIKVTNNNNEALIPENSTDALKGKYRLIYDDYESSDITTKGGLWSAIEAVDNSKREFDVNKAKLVRYVTYYVSYVGSFTSIDLAKGVTDNEGINYLNERKTAASIWEIISFGYYKFVSGDSLDTGLNEYLQTHDFANVTLNNKGRIYLTGTNPSTWQTNASGEHVSYQNASNGKVYHSTFDSEDKYPVEVSDLAAALKSETNPTAGKKYNIENWEFWPCEESSGNIYPKSKETVVNKDKITVDYYDGWEDYGDVLVYFPQVDITVSVTASVPVIGETPASTTVRVPQNDGYTITDVSWSVDGTELTSADKFEEGKQYTVAVTLKPDTGLQFIGTTPVSINGKAADAVLNNDGTLTVSRSFVSASRVSIDMPSEDLMNAVLDDYDKELLKQYPDLDISVLVATITIDPENVPEEDAAAIDSVLGEYTIGCYLDVNLFKRYSNGLPDREVTDPSAPITLRFIVPDRVLQQYPPEEYVYSVFCSHDGEGFPVECSYDAATNTMSFTSDKFSIYALGVAARQDDTSDTSGAHTITTDSHIKLEGTSFKPGDRVNYRVDDLYVAYIYVNGEAVKCISGTGSFIMPEGNVKIVCYKGGGSNYMLTAGVARSYVYSYDTDMNSITVSATKKKNDYIIVDLGKEYAGKSFTVYEGRKSTEVKITEGTFDENGRFTLDIDHGMNYTLIVED